MGTNGSEKIAKIARWILLLGIFLMAGLLVIERMDDKDPTTGLPRVMSRAQAETLGAAPGFIILTTEISAGRKFYLIDTTKKVICVYSMTGDQLRLVGAREFTQDMEIKDASLDLRGAKGIVLRKPEGGTGITRTEAQAYAETQKKLMEEAEKNRR